MFGCDPKGGWGILVAQFTWMKKEGVGNSCCCSRRGSNLPMLESHRGGEGDGGEGVLKREFVRSYKQETQEGSRGLEKIPVLWRRRIEQTSHHHTHTCCAHPSPTCYCHSRWGGGRWLVGRLLSRRRSDSLVLELPATTWGEEGRGRSVATCIFSPHKQFRVQ